MVLGGLGYLAIPSQAFALNDFTVNPDPYTNYNPGSFVADSISGVSSGLIKLDASTQTATESGYLEFSSFVNGSALNSSDTGLNFSFSGNTGYGLYATFNLGASLASGTFGANGSTYNLSSLVFDMYIDPSMDNMFINAAIGGTEATVSGTGDDIKIASGSLFGGSAAINGGGVALNAVTDFSLTAAGEAFFVDPDPFYNLAFNAFNNTGGAIAFGFDPTVGCTDECEIAVISGVGTVDFENNVPEPTSLALIGMGILGFCFSKKRQHV